MGGHGWVTLAGWHLSGIWRRGGRKTSGCWGQACARHHEQQEGSVVGGSTLWLNSWKRHGGGRGESKGRRMGDGKRVKGGVGVASNRGARPHKETVKTEFYSEWKCSHGHSSKWQDPTEVLKVISLASTSGTDSSWDQSGRQEISQERRQAGTVCREKGCVWMSTEGGSSRICLRQALVRWLWCGPGLLGWLRSRDLLL